MRILVCEDQKDLNKIITKHLTAEGYSADSCYDGQEALDFMDMADYDAVILDVMIPKKDGFAVLRDAFSQKCDARFVSHRQRLYRRRVRGLTWVETTI
ncbi:MAG: response regulator [Oscillospiraceae bacterium]